MLQLLRFLVSSALNYCLIMSLRQANLRLQGRQPLPRHRRRCALAVARLRPGRTTVQQQYRQETLSSNRDALEYLASLGVDRVACMIVFSKASEALFYAAQRRAAAPTAAAAALELWSRRRPATGLPAAPDGAFAAAADEDEEEEAEEAEEGEWAEGGAALALPLPANEAEEGDEDEAEAEAEAEPSPEEELTRGRIEAAVGWLRAAGVPPAALTQLLVSQPSILAYDLARLEALSAYLAELGVGGERLGAVLVGRPSLLGLTVDRNLRLMVDYLRSVGTDEETLLKYITESL